MQAFLFGCGSLRLIITTDTQGCANELLYQYLIGHPDVPQDEWELVRILGKVDTNIYTI